MSDINYTFIIPHKNSLKLLKRCLYSIPKRKDVQIIVVDDDSYVSDEEWQCLKTQKSFLLLKTKGCKSAGAVRNVGIPYAKGRWILFADCDDYYVNGFLTILDEYVDNDDDVIYFNADCIDSNILKGINKIIINCKTNPQIWLDFVRYKIRNPWMKMVQRSFIINYNIKFEDIVLGNDIWYSIQVGYFAKKITVLDEILYIYSYNSNSITNKRTIEKNVAEIEGYIKLNSFYKFINHPEWHISYLGYIKYNLLNRTHPLLQFFAYIKNSVRLFCIRNLYVNQLKNASN